MEAAALSETSVSAKPHSIRSQCPCRRDVSHLILLVRYQENKIMSRVSESPGLNIAVCRIFIEFGSGVLYKQSRMRDWPGSGPTDGHALFRGVNDLCVPATFLDGSGYIRCKTCCTLCVSLVEMRAEKAAVLCCRRLTSHISTKREERLGKVCVMAHGVLHLQWCVNSQLADCQSALCSWYWHGDSLFDCVSTLYHLHSYLHTNFDVTGRCQRTAHVNRFEVSLIHCAQPDG
jgi:hypothetical protein